MRKAMNSVQKARRMTGMTQDQAARLIGRSKPYLVARERDPKRMTLGEFQMLYRACGEDEKALMDDYLDELRG